MSNIDGCQLPLMQDTYGKRKGQPRYKVANDQWDRTAPSTALPSAIDRSTERPKFGHEENQVGPNPWSWDEATKDDDQFVRDQHQKKANTGRQ